MLEDHFGRADFDTVAAVGTFIFEHNISAVVTPDNSVLRASYQALTALSTDMRLKQPRLRETRLDTEACLFGIDFLKMADCANLGTQTAAAAFARRDPKSF